MKQKYILLLTILLFIFGIVVGFWLSDLNAGCPSYENGFQACLQKLGMEMPQILMKENIRTIDQFITVALYDSTGCDGIISTLIWDVDYNEYKKRADSILTSIYNR